MKNIYSVINIDIVNSRKITHRDAFQEQLKAYLNALSQQYAAVLVAPITITLGDEWQIVLKDIGESYNICMNVQQYLTQLGATCYCGIGIGEMSTRESQDTREMDGQAFILARESLNIAKCNKNAYSKMIPTKDCKIFFKGPNLSEATGQGQEEDFTHIIFEDIINNIIQNNETHLKKITRVQQQVINAYEELGSYSAVENKEKISKSNVSNRLKASNYWLIEANRQMIGKLLKQYEITLKRGV
nr:SatD family protein [uncultured Cellulosilyticum sp.]